MTTYKDIHGTQVEVRSDDPSNPVNGQIWYNTTDRKLRGHTVNPVGAWASGGNLNVAKQQMGQTGSQTSALGFGGETSGAVAVTTNELYNGSAWTEVNDLNVAKYRQAAAGSDATSAL